MSASACTDIARRILPENPKNPYAINEGSHNVEFMPLQISLNLEARVVIRNATLSRNKFKQNLFRITVGFMQKYHSPLRITIWTPVT